MAPGKGIEIFHDPILPKVINDDWKEVQPPILSSDSKAPRFSWKKLWISVAAILILIISVAFGIAFGLRAKKTDNTTHSKSIISATSRSILNDSSLAALALSNGDRRLFYQEHTGQIKQAAYSFSSRSWPSTLNLVIASDARNGTPLAAVNLASEGDVHTPGVNYRYSYFRSREGAELFFFRFTCSTLPATVLWL